MARLNIYLSDDLKARMDEIGNSVNWSEVVRPIIQAEVASHKHRSKQTMETAIERLRASKEQQQQADKQDGKHRGRAWAENQAEYKELVRVYGIDWDPRRIDGTPLGSLQQALEYDDEEVCEVLQIDCIEEANDEYVTGFVEGAWAFFEEVRDKI